MRYAIVPTLVLGLALLAACGQEAAPSGTPSEAPAPDSAVPAADTVTVVLTIDGMT